MELEHRPGRLHGNADGLSRIPCKQCEAMSKKYDSDEPSTAINQCPQVTTQAEQHTDQFDIASLQARDEELTEIRSWGNNKERPIFKNMANRGNSIKALLNQF